MATPSTRPRHRSLRVRPKIVVTGGLAAPAAIRAATTATTFVLRGSEPQEAVGGDEEVSGRFVEPRSHEPLCRLRA